MNTLLRLVLPAAFAAAAAATAAEPATITISADKPGHKVAPTLWGVFFEDINLSADGGLYAELLRNRSFEDSDEPQHWSTANAPGAAATLRVTCEQPWADNPLNTRNKRSLRLDITTATPAAPAGISTVATGACPSAPAKP